MGFRPQPMGGHGGFLPDYVRSVEYVTREWPGSNAYTSAQAYAAGLVAQKCVEESGTLENQALLQAARNLDFTTFFGHFKVEYSTGRQIGH